MTIKEALRARLLADPTVRGIVGDRVYLNAAPESARAPYLVFQQVSGVPAGALAAESGTARYRFQVSSIAETEAAAQALAAAVHGPADGAAGMRAWRDALVSGALLIEEHDDFENPSDGGEVLWPRVIQDYAVWCGGQ